MPDHFIQRRGIAPFDFYPYNPSEVAGWIFVALFAISTVIHFGLAIRYRSWFFIPFLMGCLGTALFRARPRDEGTLLTRWQLRQEDIMAGPGHTTTGGSVAPMYETTRSCSLIIIH